MLAGVHCHLYGPGLTHIDASVKVRKWAGAIGMSILYSPLVCSCCVLFAVPTANCPGGTPKNCLGAYKSCSFFCGGGLEDWSGARRVCTGAWRLLPRHKRNVNNGRPVRLDINGTAKFNVMRCTSTIVPWFIGLSQTRRSSASAIRIARQ